MSMLQSVASAYLDAYEEELRLARRRNERQQMEKFISWDDLRTRLKCKPEVWARIRRMNPDHRGVKPFGLLRGYHPNHRQHINMDVIGPKQFIARFGREAYRAIPANRLVRRGHRKLITAEYCMDMLHG